MELKPGARAGLLTAGAAVCWAQAAHLSLVVNGAVASDDVRVIAGRPYVPLDDVARAYHQTLVKNLGGYALIAGNGASVVNMGQELSRGPFRFQVTGVRWADTYTERHEPNQMTIGADGADTLCAIDCRLRNGTRRKQQLVFSPDRADGNPDTALTDDQGRSFPPFRRPGGAFSGYDVQKDNHFPDGACVPPGAALDFAVVFSVPRGTKPNALVFSILRYDDRGHAGDKAANVRVSLAP